MAQNKPPLSNATPSPELLAGLREELREDQVLTAQEDILPYGFDGTAGVRRMPMAVVFPETTEEVATILKLAQSQGVTIVTRGSGTGLSAGCVPVETCIVLVTVKMDRILEVDEKNLTLLAECGAISLDIEEKATEHGLFYPPDPSSMKITTIGGNVAENSGGLRGLKYGVTRNYVMGLEVVLANGEIIWLGNKCMKDVAGFSLKDLFIGSEGTLGIVTKVLLRLVPRPEARRTLIASFNRIEDAAQTVSDIIAAKIIPCTLEFLDQATIRCVEDYAKVGLPVEAEAMLLMESDGHPEVVKGEAGKMEEIACRNNATTTRAAKTSEEATELATARRAAFSALARLRPSTILEDATVPRSELVRMVRGTQEIARKYDLQIANFGHMGDGNLHPTVLTDTTDKVEMEKVEKACKEIFQLAIDLGGTITGEHGVGEAKREYLKLQYRDYSYELLRTVKRSLDPQNLLNPGKVVSI